MLLPNPRGSFGQGEAFTRANVKDFGHGDLLDILAGVDEVVKTFPVDDKRIGIAGWSYGGYMTMWAVTQTQRFRAAVAGAGIANWQSYYGQNLIDQWIIPFFGASVYDDPAIYAIGDVAGEPMLAHKASHEGRTAVEAIAGHKVAFEPAAIPAVVFTDPEVAWCGLTETQAQKDSREVKVAKFAWAACGRAVTLDRPEGMTKLIIDPQTERVLGVGIVANVLIVYVIAQVFAEHKQNQEREPGADY